MQHEHLTQALRLCAPVVAAKSTMPILASVLLSNAEKEGMVEIRATDLEREIIVTFPGKLHGAPAVGLMHKSFLRVLDAGWEINEELHLEVEGGKLTITGAKTRTLQKNKMQLNTLEADDFPASQQVLFFKNEKVDVLQPAARINAMDLLDAFDYVQKAALPFRDDAPHLQYLASRPDGFIGGANGHRCQMVKLSKPLSDQEFLIHYSTAEMLRTSLSMLFPSHFGFVLYSASAKGKTMHQPERRGCLYSVCSIQERESPGTGVSIKLFDAYWSSTSHPLSTMETWMPHTWNQKSTAPTEFIEKAASIARKLDLRNVALVFHGKHINIQGCTVNGEKYSSEVPLPPELATETIANAPSPLFVAVSPKYLREALPDGENVRLFVVDEKTPLIIESEDGRYRAAIMPYRFEAKNLDPE